MKNIVILGSTGSIGTNTLDVVSSFPDEFRVIALSANLNISLLAEQIRKFKPKIACVTSKDSVVGIRAQVKRYGTKIISGPEGLVELAAHPDADIVVMAIVGSASLLPLLAAINAGKRVALASKEALVCAGEIVMKTAKKKGAKIVPVDSEHSAIFQCLNGRDPAHLKKIYLTGSGGPLKDVPRGRFDKLTPRQVTNHPKWKMGKKISVDSATLMNKGLEVIEAKWLFGTPLDKIEVLIHPQAAVHSMVEFMDGSVLAQMGPCDMRLPIQYALTYPLRQPRGNGSSLDFKKIGALTFEQPDRKRFPCLELAYEAAGRGGTATAVLNAANEEAVGCFLAGGIKFTDIPKVIRKVLSAHRKINSPGLGEILEADREAREEARRLCYR